MGDILKYGRLNGFTLVEVLVSIALMGLVIGYFVHARLEHLKLQLGENIAHEVMSLSNLVMSYHVTVPNVGQWPGSASTPACSNALGILASNDYLPSGYQPHASATLTTSCSSGNEGSFDITLQFSDVDSDLAQIVRTSLPMAEITTGGGTIQLVHRVFPPRRAGKQYYFARAVYQGNGRFIVSKPHCGTSTPRYVAIPQRICVNHNDGLQGYYLDVHSQNNNEWAIELYVGTLSGSGSAPTVVYSRHTYECNGEDPEVAAVTYCE